MADKTQSTTAPASPGTLDLLKMRLGHIDRLRGVLQMLVDAAEREPPTPAYATAVQMAREALS